MDLFAFTPTSNDNLFLNPGIDFSFDDFIALPDASTPAIAFGDGAGAA